VRVRRAQAARDFCALHEHHFVELLIRLRSRGMIVKPFAASRSLREDHNMHIRTNDPLSELGFWR